MLNSGLNRLLSHSTEETIAIGKKIGAGLAPGSIVCLYGDLGAGKTCLTKGLALGVGVQEERQVNSPTFVYLNIYQGFCPIYHFDLYRLKGEDDFLSMGFDEMLFSEGISVIEWPSRIASLLPQNVLSITMRCVGSGREIIIQ